MGNLAGKSPGNGGFSVFHGKGHHKTFTRPGYFDIAMGNDPFIEPIKMVIFHGYVK